MDSKLAAYPFYVLLYLQCRHAIQEGLEPPLLNCGPMALACSGAAIDQMLTVEQFYRVVRSEIGASHSALLSEDFLVEHGAAVRKAFAADQGTLGHDVSAAL